jgi:hypothetical protein
MITLVKKRISDKERQGGEKLTRNREVKKERKRKTKEGIKTKSSEEDQ